MARMTARTDDGPGLRDDNGRLFQILALTALAAALASGFAVSRIHLPPKYTSLPLHDSAPWAILCMMLVSVVGFLALYRFALRGQGRFVGGLGLAVVLAAAGIGGTFALYTITAPRTEVRSLLSLTETGLAHDDADLVVSHTQQLQAIDPDARLSPLELGRTRGLAAARKAVTDAIGRIEGARAAYGQLVANARTALLHEPYAADLVEEARGRVETRHQTLSPYWDLQDAYAALLREQLTLLETRRWRVIDTAIVFSDPADQKAYEALLARRARLSQTIDAEAELRKDWVI
ncbi:hypothetical protein GVN21_19760 [Caulobacter sp. SLTY]|uniref:hypothetical protein n=1 Tax=Caulobacter sp. SLTY TaxID=2683262 RepID=UPI001411F656|nr:hypothetical protein [Caulobacter sp. SLTY]NBB17603.1 hypothetical protein [Caulobacter sp. SLTY]